MVEFNELNSIYSVIECYHLALKQVCSIERFMMSQRVAGVSPISATGVNN